MKAFSYLFIDLGCLILPFVLSFLKIHPFYKKWKAFFITNLFVGLFFIIWDEIFTKLGIWGFSPEYLTGIYLSYLPVEEILFFICIPYCTTFTFFALQHYVKTNPLEKYHKSISYVLLVTLCILTLIGYNQRYTLVTFILTSLFLIYCLIQKISLADSYLTYITIFPFFLISNGFLTRNYSKTPIVWYNPSDFFGFRIGSIPAEDSIYGFLLVSLHIVIFKFLIKKT